MKYKHFILGGVLGLFGLIVILWLANLSGTQGDAEFVFRGQAEPFQANALARVSDEVYFSVMGAVLPIRQSARPPSLGDLL